MTLDPKKMARQAIKGQPQMSKDALDSAVEMLCMNEIPVEAKPGEFMQCGGQIFVEAHRLKFISPIMSPTGQKTIATINIGKLCIVCGKIFNPEEWEKQYNELLVKKKIEQSSEGKILDKDGNPT